MHWVEEEYAGIKNPVIKTHAQGGWHAQHILNTYMLTDIHAVVYLGHFIMTVR